MAGRSGLDIRNNFFKKVFGERIIKDLIPQVLSESTLSEENC